MKWHLRNRFSLTRRVFYDNVTKIRQKFERRRDMKTNIHKNITSTSFDNVFAYSSSTSMNELFVFDFNFFIT